MSTECHYFFTVQQTWLVWEAPAVVWGTPPDINQISLNERTEQCARGVRSPQLALEVSRLNRLRSLLCQCYLHRLGMQVETLAARGQGCVLAKGGALPCRVMHRRQSQAVACFCPQCIQPHTRLRRARVATTAQPLLCL